MHAKVICWTRGVGTLLLGLLLATGGCAVYQETGDNPARLLVSARGQVTPAMVADALVRKTRLQFEPLGGAEDVSAPLWDLRAFVARPDGRLVPLRPLKPVMNVEGHQFETTAEFLAPAGSYEVVFLLECSVRHTANDFPPSYEYIYIVTKKVQRNMEFCPGCRVEASPFEAIANRP